MSGAAVSTRGRYMNQEERKNPSKNPSDRPLYLHIQAVNQQDVKGVGTLKPVSNLLLLALTNQRQQFTETFSKIKTSFVIFQLQ